MIGSGDGRDCYIGPMTTPEFKDKFIAFIDILGFKQMIEAAEKGTGRSLGEIDELCAELGGPKNKARFEAHGPITCPQSARIQKGMDFEISQITDCAIVSAEVSPAGVMNLAHHCWVAAITLLTKGVMVRGYITRGKIFHEGMKIYGTGYHDAYNREAGVTAFKREADEKGTPFVEIDPSVVSYVADETDACVREMFGRLVKTDGSVTALFPFQVLGNSWAIGYGMPKLDLNEQKQKNANMRQQIEKLKMGLLKYVDPSNAGAMSKVTHYLTALDAQIAASHKSDEILDQLFRPIGSRR